MFCPHVTLPCSFKGGRPTALWTFSPTLQLVGEAIPHMETASTALGPMMVNTILQFTLAGTSFKTDATGTETARLHVERIELTLE